MKIIKLILFFILINNVVLEAKPSFNKLIKETNRYLMIYSQLNPFEIEYDLNSLGLSTQEKKDFLKDYKDDDQLVLDTKAIDTQYLIQFYQYKILDNLDKIIEHKKFSKKDITQLLDNSGELFIVKSEDNKLYNFSLDEKTGGSYRSRISWMYYTETPYEKHEQHIENNSNNFSIFHSDGFDEIYTLKTTEGVKYLLIGHVRGCSYCFETHVLLTKFEDGIFKSDFEYAINIRDYEKGLAYDSTTKTIYVEYISDDLTPFCNCNDEDNISEIDEQEYNTLECKCIFKFNGNNFELIHEEKNEIESKEND